MNLHKAAGSWKLKILEDCPAIYTSKPPCWFHRVMQRVFFGFRWTRE